MMNQEEFVGPVNLGNPSEFTILSLANQIIELAGSKSRVIFKSLPSDDPTRRQPDIRLAKTKLGWDPKVQLKEGLERTIRYFREVLQQV